MPDARVSASPIATTDKMLGPVHRRSSCAGWRRMVGAYLMLVRAQYVGAMVLCCVGCAVGPDDPRTTDAVLRRLKPGAEVTIGGMFEMMDGLTRRGWPERRGDFLLTAYCGNDADRLTLRINPSALNPTEYEIGTVRVRSVESPLVERAEHRWGKTEVSSFLARTGPCERVYIFAGGPTVTIDVDEGGRIRSVSTSDGSARGRP